MYEVTVEDGQPHRTKAKRPRPVVSPDSECVVCASLPGLVTQVLVSVGQEVSAGETLVILESMKMENEMLASRQGTVEKVYVAAGDTPNLDDPLITLC